MTRFLYFPLLTSYLTAFFLYYPVYMIKTKVAFFGGPVFSS